MKSANDKLGWARIDWKTILIFVLLVFIGWLNIYAAVYNEATAAGFQLSSKYGMQLLWIGISTVVAIVILLIDDIYYHLLAYPAYVLMLCVLVLTLVIGKEVNGAKAWLVLGPVSIQPAEFMKVATALALARFASEYDFSLSKPKGLIGTGLLLLIPIAIILLQNDMGSALVYCSFFLMLFREGLNPWVYYAIFLVVGLFVGSFILSPVALLVLLLLLFVASQLISNHNLRESTIFIAGVGLLSLVIYAVSWLAGWELTYYGALLISSFVMLVPALTYAYRRKLSTIYLFGVMFICSVVFLGAVDYVFNDVLQIHQQKRILDLLGLESDLKGWGYNVHQSKIAIGSGGFLGKGFLEGTQTKYDFIPEQSTDFIFCTVGEEWGFVGSLVVLTLFATLIIRLMKMGERQQEPFRRVYCYGVAGIFLFHTIINIGMTIGLMPVIGIPLPMFSYGGSSLLAFTVLFFIAVRLDSQNSIIDSTYKPY
ncbi:MAG: rod shape-determining protein RodA [Tidjanibacter sp.]|nr:rod shape-determining protein RodA [Tidjanibacter sp.]MBQ2248304.1 rod shape-determining protein RodA [Tidjanibacter sp.]